MDAKWRFGATAVIWFISAIISIIVLVNSMFLEDWVLAIPLGIAMIATIAIWESGNSAKYEAKSSSRSESVKQTDNTAYSMALLMEMMDEDEREEFKHNLKQRILSG
ncbi:MAG TPA: hypothetical protein PLZ51_06635, partial [Aggregatilineales bacterium]|nr:hypothetical protein [Aggregatilineales bacterium]